MTSSAMVVMMSCLLTRRSSSSSRASEAGWCCRARSRMAIFFSASAASADALPRALLRRSKIAFRHLDRRCLQQSVKLT